MESIFENMIKSMLESNPDSFRAKIGDKNLNADTFLGYSNIDFSDNYTCFIPVNVDNKYRSLYTILFQSIRLSALLHDVGHPPFSHITEYALKEIWNEITNSIPVENMNTRQKKFCQCMKKYFQTTKDLHEQIGNKITEKVLADIIHNISLEDERNQECIKLQVFKILVSEVTSSILQEKNKTFGELHRIIDGTLDGDRLDYVCRDPINSGLNVGKIEYDRIITSIKLVIKDECFVFVPASKILDSIDDFFNRRWKMYKQIIYHHRVIKTDYLMQNCITTLALEYLRDDSPEINCKNILPYDISGLWKAIEDKPSYSDYFDTLIQWDDGWLMTIMKVHYFEKYANEYLRTPMGYRLEELLANKKNYVSVIKRKEDFEIIDKSVANILLKEYTNLKTKIEEIIVSSENNITQESSNQLIVELNPVLKIIRKFIDSFKDDYKQISKDGFLLVKLNRVFSNLLEPGWLNSIIDESVKTVADEKELDSFSVIKKIKTGIPGGKTYISGGLGIYYLKGNETFVQDYTDISNCNNILNSDVAFMPTFYMYVFRQAKDINYDSIKGTVGELIGQKSVNLIVQKLESLINL